MKYLYIGAIFLLASLLLGMESCSKNTAQNNTPPVFPDWAKNKVLYECNIRQFSEAGNFKAVEAALPRLNEMGIGILWLMPIHPIGVKNRKGQLGSPYSVRDYKAINPDYGNADDLKQLVGRAHELGMKVILDWVPNHTAWDHVWISEHPEYYSRYNGAFTVPLNEHGEPIADWSDVCDLNYDSKELHKAMIEAMQYWIMDFDFDGFRVDRAGLVPTDFWAAVRPALDSIKPVFMLSEWQDEPGHFSTAFNVNYGWKWKDVTKDIAKGNANALALDSLQTFLDAYYPPGYSQLYFTQNHDENTWSGSEIDLYGQAADAVNVLSFTWAGMPMVYNGQEDILVQQLGFFNASPIRWKQYAKNDFYHTLCFLRRNNQALWTSHYGGIRHKIKSSAEEQVYAFYREKNGDCVLVVVNLSEQPKAFTLKPAPQISGTYRDVFDHHAVTVKTDMSLTLGPWEYLVLTNK